MSSRAKSRDLADSILQTLKYSDHFGFPLTLSEIHSRLIEVKIRQIRLIHPIRLMLKSGIISQTDSYYHLPNRTSLVARRLKRVQLSYAQLTRARSLAKRLGRLPGVMAIYLTGSLAMANSDLGSDIDLMIITQPGKLWTTRLILTLYTSLLRLRRTPGSTQNSGKVCLNLYLTPMSYELPSHKQSLYTAYELIQAVPLYDPHHTRIALLTSNHWLKKYLPNSPAGPGPAGPKHLPARPGPIGTMLELLAYHLQLWYMRPRLTREYITKNSAFFHPHDPGAKVLKKLQV